GIYEVVVKLGSTLEKIKFGRLTAFDKVIYRNNNSVKEFDAVSDNTVFEFKFHLTLRKLYQQVIGIDSARQPHLLELIQNPNFQGIRNLVYFGEADNGYVSKALKEFIRNRPQVASKVILTNKGLSLRLTLMEVKDFLESESTIDLALREQGNFSGKIDRRAFRQKTRFMETLINRKLKQLKGEHFDVIIAMSNVAEKDRQDIRIIISEITNSVKNRLSSAENIDLAIKELNCICEEAIVGYKALGKSLENFTYNYDPLGKGPYWASSYQEAARLLSYAGVKKGDTMLDVGHGAGDTISLLAHLFKLQAKGVEILPEHNEYAVFLRDLMVKKGYLKDGQVVLENKDFMDESIKFSEYDFIYYFCKGTYDRKELLSRLLTVKIGAKILMYGAYEPEIENKLTKDNGFVSQLWGRDERYHNGRARIYTRVERNSQSGFRIPELVKAMGIFAVAVIVVSLGIHFWPQIWAMLISLQHWFACVATSGVGALVGISALGTCLPIAETKIVTSWKEKLKIINHIYAEAYEKYPEIKGMFFKNLGKGTFLPSFDSEEIIRIFGIVKRNYPSARKLFDLGSGDGRIAILAALCGFQAVGVEYSEPLVRFSEYVKNRLQESGITEAFQAEFKQGDALNFIDTSYDVIFMALGGTVGEERIQRAINEKAKNDAVIIVNHPKFKFDKFRPLKNLMIWHPFIFGEIEGKTMVYGPKSECENIAGYLKRIVPHLAEVVVFLEALKTERVISRYYITGSFARGEFNNNSHDLDFVIALSMHYYNSYEGIEEQKRIIAQFKEISNRAGITMHISFVPFGRIFKFDDSAELVEAGGVLRPEIVKANHKESILVDIMGSQIRKDEFFIKLYSKLTQLKLDRISGVEPEERDVRFIEEICFDKGHPEGVLEKEKFGDFAATYKLFALRIIKFAKTLNPQGKICDLGSGNGAFCFYAARHFQDVVGIEGRKELRNVSLGIKSELIKQGVYSAAGVDFGEKEYNFLDESVDLSGYDILYLFYTKPQKFNTHQDYYGALRQKLISQNGMKAGAVLLVFGCMDIISDDDKLTYKSLSLGYNGIKLSIYKRQEKTDFNMARIDLPYTMKMDDKGGSSSPLFIDSPEESHEVVLNELEDHKKEVPEGKIRLVLNFDMHSDKYGRYL
ncbi:MAG: class I SAM-dependent methyltransferase, partial [Candidatus Omnitrophota bacterium]